MELFAPWLPQLQSNQKILQKIFHLLRLKLNMLVFVRKKQINYNYLIGILWRKCANCLQKTEIADSCSIFLALSHLILKDFHILNAFKFLQSLYSSVSFPSNYLCYCSILPACANFNQEKNKERMSEEKWMGRFSFLNEIFIWGKQRKGSTYR